MNIHQFSRHLGLSISTVSKALNDYRDVSPATRERVLKAARDLGYEPTSSARSLRRQGTDRIGLINPSELSGRWGSTITADYFMRLLTGVTRGAERYNKNLMIYTAHPVEDTVMIHRIAASREVDALLVVGGGNIDKELSALENLPVPWLLLGRKCASPHISWIEPDNYQGGRIATEHLIGQGHRNIAYIGQQEDQESNSARFQGYRDALSAQGIPFLEELVAWAPFRKGGGREAMDELLSRGVQFTGAFFFCDNIFFEARELLDARGISVPDQLAVVGFDDTLRAGMERPGITSVHVPLEAMGERGVELLLQAVETPRRSPVQETFPVSLKVRRSSGGAG